MKDQNEVIVMDLGSSAIRCLRGSKRTEEEYVVSKIEEVPSVGILRGAIEDSKALEGVVSEMLHSVGYFDPPENLSTLYITGQGVFSQQKENSLAATKTPPWQKSSKRNLESLMKAIGVPSYHVIYVHEALGSSILSANNRALGCCLVDIGKGKTVLSVYYNQQLQLTAVIPIGGQLATSDVQEKFSLSPQQAEQLKVHCGSAASYLLSPDYHITILRDGWKDEHLSVVVLANVIQSRYAQIVDSIYFLMERMKLTNIRGGILLSGGGAQLDRLPQFIVDRIKIEAKMATPKYQFSGIDAEDPSYHCLLGAFCLAWEKNMDSIQKNVNNNPPPKRKQKKGTLNNWAKKMSKLGHRFIDTFGGEDIDKHE